MRVCDLNADFLSVSPWPIARWGGLPLFGGGGRDVTPPSLKFPSQNPVTFYG